ncbi:MAG: adenylate/guanylate cyclase domain-containing protein [Cyanobacteria bacterium J06621_11]
MTMLLAVSIGSIAVIAYEGYRSGRFAIRDSVVERLVSLRSSRANQIEEYFRGLRGEMKVLGNSPSTVDAVKELSTAFDSVLGESKSIDATRVGGLRQYYRDEFAPRLAENTGQSVNADTFLPASILARYLQYEYVADNPNPIGEKQELNDADDGSNYSQLHARYHPIFREVVKEFGYYDLFLIDNDGNIVYSVFKESDFATSLLLGPYARSSLADAYRDAQRQNSGYVAIADFSFYSPSYGAPAAFMATPVYEGTELIGVLAIQVPIDEVNSVMTDNSQWRQSGLGETGETFLVGSDKTLRSDSRKLIEAPGEYLDVLRAQQVSEEDIAQVNAMQTSVLNQKAVSEAVEKSLEGKSGVDTVTNYLGERVISAYAPLDIRGVDWVLIAEINENEIFQPIAVFAQRVLIAAVGLVLLITLASLWLARSFLKPVNLLGEGFQRLSRGNKEVLVPVLADDELGELAKAFNHMVKKNRKTTELVFQKTQETEALLLNMFPESVAKRLKKGTTAIADDADSVTVLFANVLNFQKLTCDLQPKKAIAILNEIVSALDDLTNTYGIEKIKTTGSEYLAVSGLSVARLDHSKRIIDFAIESIRIVSQVNREYGTDLQMRLGVHTGSVMAGTVGSQRLIYDVWGDTVVTAHYVQSAARPDSIFVSKAVANSLIDLYEFEPEGEIESRGGEKVPIFRVNV